MVKNKKEENKDIDTGKELQLEKDKNIKLEKKLGDLTSMVEKLIKQSSNQKDEIKEKTNKSALETYKEVDPYKRVLLINMVDAGGTYVTHNGKSIRFDRCGQIMPARFEDVESLRNKYRSHFENLEIRIIDDEDIVNALYLKPFYDKFKISFEDLENLITLNAQDMIKKIKELPKSLQESALSMIIGGVARKESAFTDKNKWAVIKNEFNIDIEELSSTYYVD